jgi:protein involved in polysaccharide export with SLBB domain
MHLNRFNQMNNLFSASRMLVLSGCLCWALGTGCATGKGNGARAKRPAPEANRSVPNPPPQDTLPGDARPAVAEWATLRPGLVINVAVVVAGKKQIEEVGRRVSENGALTLPLLGALSVGGETLDSFTLLLTDRYREFFVDPQVIVEFVRNDQTVGISPWGYVTVLGQVKRPGRVDIPPTRDLTVSLAIQQAGGFDVSAKETAIAVTRRTDDGQNTTRQINLREIGKRGQVDKDIVLLPDDVVYVPELIF